MLRYHHHTSHWARIIPFCNRYLVPTLLGKGISPSQKFWQTVFLNKNFLQPMRRLNMHSRRPNFIFLLGLGTGEGIFWVFVVPNVFRSSLQRVPNVFPNMLRVAPHFYPIYFGQSWTFFNINYKAGPNGSIYVLLSAQCFTQLLMR